MMIHMTNTHIIPYMVWNESNLDLEWYYGPKPAQQKYSHELLRAESLGRQSGNVPLVLASSRAGRWTNRWPTRRTRLAPMMVHEIKFVMDNPIERQLMGLMIDFGCNEHDCDVFDYWDDKYPVKVSDSEVKAALLRRGGLYCCSSARGTNSPETVVFDFDAKALGLTPAHAGEPEYPNVPPVTLNNARRLGIDLKPYDVRLFVIE